MDDIFSDCHNYLVKLGEAIPITVYNTLEIPKDIIYYFLKNKFTLVFFKLFSIILHVLSVEGLDCSNFIAQKMLTISIPSCDNLLLNHKNNDYYLIRGSRTFQFLVRRKNYALLNS